MYQLHPGTGSSQRILANLVLKAARSPVLDVGAAEGYLGRLLEGSGLAIDALEPNKGYASAAQPYYRKLYQARVEEVALEEQYGVIVFGDVLEHLVEPAAVLKQLMVSLAPNGVVLVSVPNVAHLAVRLLLLSGRFPRMDRGPLDRTHLHFFTWSTIEGLLETSNLRVLERHSSVAPIPDMVGPLLSPFARLGQLGQLAAARVLPGPFTYQWVFMAERALTREYVAEER